MPQYDKDVGTHIVTSGNLTMVPAGTVLWELKGASSRVRKVFSPELRPGRLVAYTNNIGEGPIAVDVSNLDLNKSRNIKIAVAHDSKGDGVVDSLRHLGRDVLSSCNLAEASASSPQCGAPAVQDFFFSCTQCEEAYTLQVRVDDQSTRDWAPLYKSFQDFNGVATPDCLPACNECLPEANCTDLAQKLRKSLLNDLDLKIDGKSYPDLKAKGLKRPFDVHVIQDRSLVYCFSLSDSGCTDCDFIETVGRVSLNGNDYPITGVADISDPTKTPKALLDTIKVQIEDAFEQEFQDDGASASIYVTGSYSECCDLQVHVNVPSAALFVMYNSEGGTIQPKSETNLLDGRDGQCGLRVIAERISGTCGCYLEKPLGTYGRFLDVRPIGDAWLPGDWEVVVAQKTELPGGFGAAIQFLEYQQKPGGEGFDYDWSNTNKGWLNLPGAKARVNNAVTAECDKDYCSYYLQFIQPRKAVANIGAARPLQINGNIHVPIKDTVTVADWEAFQALLISFHAGCETVMTTTCNGVAVNVSVEGGTDAFATTTLGLSVEEQAEEDAE